MKRPPRTDLPRSPARFNTTRRARSRIQRCKRYTDLSLRGPRLFQSEFERNLFALRQDKLRQISALGEQLTPTSLSRRTPCRSRQKFGEIPAEVLDRDGRLPSQGRSWPFALKAKPVLPSCNRVVNGYKSSFVWTAEENRVFSSISCSTWGITSVSPATSSAPALASSPCMSKKLPSWPRPVALPEKFHGLADAELRYRQRYVDLFMNTDVRAVFINALRCSRQSDRSSINEDTSSRDPHDATHGRGAPQALSHPPQCARSFPLRESRRNSTSRAGGRRMDRVYEINRNFRNEGVSTHTIPFTMLDFIRPRQLSRPDATDPGAHRAGRT